MKTTIYYENAKKHLESNWAQNVKTDLHLEEYNEVFKYVSENFSADAMILDWSALYGHVSHGLSLRHFEEVYAFQFKPSAGSKFSLCNLKGINPVFEMKDPSRLPFDDSKFDCVISCGVLEHVYETGGSFKHSMEEIKRILKPNGVFVLSHLPNATALAELKSDFLGSWGHAFRFTEQGLIFLAENNGFDVVMVKRIGIFPLAARIFLKRIYLGFLAQVVDNLAKLYPFKIFANDFFAILRKRPDQ